MVKNHASGYLLLNRPSSRASDVASHRWGRRGLRDTTVLVLLGSFCLGLSRPALGWGRLGHRASAQLAESRLSPRAKAVIRDLLEPGESLADAATWADENSREIPGSAAWHFVNVPISAPRYNPRYCRPQGCVVSKIREFGSILSDPRRSRAQRRMALRFFVHLVQDLHQPMHIADHNDRGGNSLQLQYGRYDATNLHQIWDSGLLARHYPHERDLLSALERVASQGASRDWPRGRLEDWANESLEVGRHAYLDPSTKAYLRSGQAIGHAYEEDNRPRAEERLARAGIRLASLLNLVLR